MTRLPEDKNTWTDEQWIYYRGLLDRHEKLQDDIVNAVIEKHGGLDCSWVDLGLFDPGHREIRVDGYVSLRDTKCLVELLELPSMSYHDIEDFDWARFDKLRDDLKTEGKKQRV